MSEYSIALKQFRKYIKEWGELMSDYIKREDAIDAVMSTEPVVFDAQSLEPHQKTKDVVTAIEQLPSADVVEVVRCKGCKWFNLNKWAKVDGVHIIVGHEICHFWGGGCKTQRDGYCSYGERKDDE